MSDPTHPVRATDQQASCQRAREDAAVALLTRSTPDAHLLHHLQLCPPSALSPAVSPSEPGEEPDEAPATGPLVAQGSAADRATGALAHVSVRRSATGGSAVRVEVEGVAAGTLCHLVLHSGAGAQADVGHWTARAGENTYSETVTTPATDLHRVEVLDGRGHRLVEVSLATV